MAKFLDTFNLPRLNHEEIENLSRPITSKEIESVIKNLPTKKSLGSDGFSGHFYQTSEDGLAILLKLFRKLEENELFPNSFYKASIIMISKPDRHYKKRKLSASIPDEKLNAKTFNIVLANQVQ